MNKARTQSSMVCIVNPSFEMRLSNDGEVMLLRIKNMTLDTAFVFDKSHIYINYRYNTETKIINYIEFMIGHSGLNPTYPYDLLKEITLQPIESRKELEIKCNLPKGLRLSDNSILILGLVYIQKRTFLYKNIVQTNNRFLIATNQLADEFPNTYKHLMWIGDPSDLKKHSQEKELLFQLICDY